MTIETAYQILFEGALLWQGVLLLIMLVRAIIGPRITDRILSINMIGTMVSCCICLLSGVLGESYLVDMALLYSMISFVSVLILASTYIAKHPERGRFADEAGREVQEEKKWLSGYRRQIRESVRMEMKDQLHAGMENGSGEERS